MFDTEFHEKELRAYWNACLTLRHGAVSDTDDAIDDLIGIHLNTEWDTLRTRVSCELNNLADRLMAAQ